MSFGRVRLYHRDKPGGEVFTDREAHDAAVAAGWVDFPTKIKTEPVQATEVNTSPEKAPAPPSNKVKKGFAPRRTRKEKKHGS